MARHGAQVPLKGRWVHLPRTGSAEHRSAGTQWGTTGYGPEMEATVPISNGVPLTHETHPNGNVDLWLPDADTVRTVRAKPLSSSDQLICWSPPDHLSNIGGAERYELIELGAMTHTDLAHAPMELKRLKTTLLSQAVGWLYHHLSHDLMSDPSATVGSLRDEEGRDALDLEFETRL